MCDYAGLGHPCTLCDHTVLCHLAVAAIRRHIRAPCVPSARGPYSERPRGLTTWFDHVGGQTLEAPRGEPMRCCAQVPLGVLGIIFEARPDAAIQVETSRSCHLIL